MMKILLLNPHLYEAPILSTLQKLGVAVIVCADFKECELVHKFHSSSITLFVGHDEDGVKMNELLKTNPRYARTPVILTTSRWSEQQCINHQASPFAANAYLRMPVDDKDFIHVIDEILGTELSHGKGFNISDDLSTIVPMATPVAAAAPIAVAAPILEEPAGIVPFAADGDGVTVIGVAGASVLSNQNGIQVEETSAVYGQPTPGVDDEGISFPNLKITLDEPSYGLNVAPESIPENTSGTVEMQTNAGEEGYPSLATPIEAISDDSPAALIVEPPTDIPMEEQATRVAFVPSFAPIENDGPAFTSRLAPEPAPGPTLTPSSPAPRVEELDPEALEAMPYLGRKAESAPTNYVNPLGYREPMDDAVVPGGAATAPDVDTLKKYLYLREQDVTALSAQLRQAREQIGNLEGQLKQEKAVCSEFAFLAQEQDRRIGGFDREKFVALESAQKEVDELKFEMKRRSEKIRVMELQVKEATDATERLKERVRVDIRKIRTREKELENRLEIMKKDSEALLGSREQKIIELKRKLDLIEFNTDLLQDQLEKERHTSASLREKLAKAAQIVRVAGGLLSPEAEALLSNGETTGATTTSAA